MIDFDKFVPFIISKWRKEKTLILEKGGLVGLANRTYGDKAEDYIKNTRIGSLKPNYTAILSPGSQSPSDIFSVARRNGYWHIMLIQVKSSSVKKDIVKLDSDDIKVFDSFVKFLIKEMKKYKGFKAYWNKPIVVSIGYAGVLRIESKKNIQHRLIDAYGYNMFLINCSELDEKIIKSKVTETHKL